LPWLLLLLCFLVLKERRQLHDVLDHLDLEQVAGKEADNLWDLNGFWNELM
jgi:hypothetical protein